MKNEKWYESRRIWGAGLTLLCTIAMITMPDKYELIGAACMMIAPYLGITSWRKPKK